MCGIAGIFSSVLIDNLEERINRMNNSIEHRGPDAGNCFIDNKIALGHRRLSIIDTSTGANQPMHSNSKRWHIVFNGEIYNFKEIKEKLNYSFVTSSDTEVIVAAVEEKGVDWFINEANGMFAIALYDSIKEELFIIRDRLGIKPLYYYYDNKHVVFASEIKAILESGLVKAEFNELAVDEYLANRYVRAPYTFFNSIFQLEAGTYLKFDSDLHFDIVRYWDLPNKFNVSSTYNEDEILNLFEKQLIKAINYRLIADVPLGTYLSGGVDSSLITAITSNLKSEKVNTYTIGFSDFNEFEYADKIVKKYNLDHHEILLKKEDYINNWEELIKMKDSPLGVPNEIPLALMSTKLKEKITVVLSGEGADELMGGYGMIFRSPFDYSNLNLNSSFYDYFISEYEYVSREMRDNFISTPKNYRNEFDAKIQSEFEGRSNEENVFKFFHKYHVKGLLQRVDTASMQAAVEARVPFLDHNLIEFVYNHVPYELKLRWKGEEEKSKATNLKSKDYSEKLDVPKYLLRKLSYKYLPREIVDRKKVGFPVPLSSWFENLEMLAREVLPEAEWLKKGILEELLAQSKVEVRAGQILWMFINIELFRKIYFRKEWRY
ncbi:asparagine synthase (glutamine-hydrolysing) [Flavobacterium cutihirudinis]|uniref:asparagine synthase (glutamine-hydrolyzing) n=1 Tax=Flavobacterium cutihirudinis TaxID=1265740 RepID=A0A3D9FKL4_9FLAO|nr:asparagine synthase (glutamine-hydrolyzing) [Flavobacterium cutihirudinis]RED19608.1 asparagine synthase (glutamine-hydrolysing) [Flavobacterium cutihirudinis]